MAKKETKKKEKDVVVWYWKRVPSKVPRAESRAKQNEAKAQELTAAVLLELARRERAKTAAKAVEVPASVDIGKQGKVGTTTSNIIDFSEINSRTSKMITPGMILEFFKYKVSSKGAIPLIEKNIIRFIRNRIFNLHQVRGGVQAAPYNVLYAHKKGVPREAVDLKVTGQLLNSLICKYKSGQSTLSDGVAGVITPIGVFEIYAIGARKSQNITNAKLALAHNNGVQRKLPARPFLELSENEINFILTESLAGKDLPDAIF